MPLLPGQVTRTGPLDVETGGVNALVALAFEINSLFLTLDSADNVHVRIEGN